MLGQSAPVGTCIAHRPHTARARTVRCKGLQVLSLSQVVTITVLHSYTERK